MRTMGAVVDRDATVDEAAELLSPLPSWWRYVWRDGVAVVVALAGTLTPLLMDRRAPYQLGVIAGLILAVAVFGLWRNGVAWGEAFSHRMATLARVEQRRNARLVSAGEGA